MRRILRYIIDAAALSSAIWVTHTAYGWPWGLVGMAAMAGYGMWCFFDGAAR